MKRRASSMVVRIGLLALAVTGLPHHPAAADLSEGLIGYWSFDGGDAKDQRNNPGYGRHGDPDARIAYLMGVPELLV